MSYDGSRVADGVRIYVDGVSQTLKVNLDDLNQSFDTKEPLRIGGGNGPENRFHGAIGDVRIYHRVLAPEEAGVVATTDSITAITAIPSADRTAHQAAKIRRFFLERQAPAAIQQAHREMLALRQDREQLIESFPTTMVMVEMPKPRDTFM